MELGMRRAWRCLLVSALIGCGGVTHTLELPVYESRPQAPASRLQRIDLGEGRYKLIRRMAPGMLEETHLKGKGIRSGRCRMTGADAYVIVRYEAGERVPGMTPVDPRSRW